MKASSHTKICFFSIASWWPTSDRKVVDLSVYTRLQTNKSILNCLLTRGNLRFLKASLVQAFIFPIAAFDNQLLTYWK